MGANMRRYVANLSDEESLSSYETTLKDQDKQYFTVAGRVKVAHKHAAEIAEATDQAPILSIVTDLVKYDDKEVVVKATVTTAYGTFTGYAAVKLDSHDVIEGAFPIEVAETSAVGRALGFAGYGLLPGGSIASAEEVRRGLLVEASAVNSELIKQHRAELTQRAEQAKEQLVQAQQSQVSDAQPQQRSTGTGTPRRRRRSEEANNDSTSSSPAPQPANSSLAQAPSSPQSTESSKLSRPRVRAIVTQIQLVRKRNPQFDVTAFFKDYGIGNVPNELSEKAEEIVPYIEKLSETDAVKVIYKLNDELTKKKS